MKSVLPRAGQGASREESGVKERRTDLDCSVGRPRCDREIDYAGSREDSPRHTQRHDGGAVRRRGEELVGDSQTLALEAALHRTGLPTDAGRTIGTACSLSKN